MLLIKKNCTINIDIKHLSSPSETKILFVFIIWLPNVDIITKFHLSLILLVMSKLISKKWVTLLSIRILSHISGESIQYWYKFIFKILTSRLSKDLTSIISPMENGFVAGRWIGDIILICHEIIHYLSVRYHCDTLCMTLKLDMRKHMIGMANFKPTQTSYLSSVLGSRSSWGWRIILHGWKLLLQGLWWQLGNGQLINVVKDCWLHAFSLCLHFYLTTLIKMLDIIEFESEREGIRSIVFESFNPREEKRS